jgi:2,3-bisphosphoglycerate-independent phosphoglycerate mutase
MTKKVALIILDWRGMTTEVERSATAKAKTPFIDSLYETVPRCTLQASEEAVGLPVGQVGNSEVGHSTLGTGRVNMQSLVRIDRAIQDRSLFDYELLYAVSANAKKNKRPVHLLGLLSDGGVHSHIQHLFALIDFFTQQETPFVVHAITDGRDTDPQSWKGFITQLKEKLWGTTGKLVSVIGRYYAMDRDMRRERVERATQLYFGRQWTETTDILSTMQQSYDAGVTDEFLDPMRLGNETDAMQPDDTVLFFNFRSDRARQITSKLMETMQVVSMTQYDETYQNVTVLFPPISLANPLGAVLSDAGKTQLRIAETEKYPHVTFFFNGGREESYPGESRIVIPSPQVATYDLQPEMSAEAVTDACLHYVQEQSPDFICLNYANPDMVGHTGVFDAVVQACETVDACLQRLSQTLIESWYTILVLADHGNADWMINADGTENTAHSLALVPCFCINWPVGLKMHTGSLADVAPTILGLMGLSQIVEMTGKSLIVS